MSFDSAIGRISQGSSPPQSRGFEAVTRRLDRDNSSGFSDDFLRRHPDMKFGTSLELNLRQRRAEKRAAKELINLRTEFAQLGKLDEFEEFVEDKGRVSTFGIVDAAMENVVQPLFDIASSGLYTTAGFTQELIRTGSAWEGFKQASIEFANAMPGIELEGARKADFINIFEEAGLSPWLATSMGLTLNILADPIMLVPGGVLAKGFTTAGKAAINRSGFIGEGLKTAFVPLHRELKGLTSTQRAGFLELQKKFERRVIDEKQVLDDRLQGIIGFMQPHERRLFGLALDDPNRFNKVLNELIEIGGIEKERVPDLLNAVRHLNETVEDRISYAADLFGKEVELNIIDPALHKANYLHATGALDPVMQRAQMRAIEERGIRSGDRSILPFGEKGLGAASPKTFKTQYDRLKAQFSGDADLTTELDVGNIFRKRSTDHVRWTNFRKFLNAMVTDGRIAARFVDDVDILQNPAEMKKLLGELPDGYGFFPVKRKTLKTTKEADKIQHVTALVHDSDLLMKRPKLVEKVTKGKTTQEVTDEIIGGYILPEPIVDFMRKGEAALSATDDVSEFWNKADKLTGFWRGWATFGTGYHLRNYISILNMNWMAGVGADYNTLREGGKWPVPGEFFLRHLQGMKLLLLAERGGRLEGLPGKALRWLNDGAKEVGFKGFDDLALPEVVLHGRKLSAEDIVRLGEEFDVPQVATKLDNIPPEGSRVVFNDLNDDALAGRIAASENLDEVEKAALLVGVGEKRTVGEKLSKVFGNDNPFMLAHRQLGQIVENSGRWTLFLDRLIKNHAPREAALATKQFHFDYRDLTNIEKRLFRVVMPFYAWQRFAAPRVLMSILDNPGRFAKLPKAKAALENLSRDMVGELPTPDYFDEVQAIQLPYVEDDRPMYMQLDLPVLEMNRFNVKDIASSLHPAIKIGIESASGNYSLFLSAPIEDFPGQTSEGLPFLTRSFEQKLSTLFPPFGKFIARPARALERGEGREQLVSELTGVRLRKLDVRRVMRAKTFEMRQLARDFKKRLLQEDEEG
jgi:hypothetical protein